MMEIDFALRQRVGLQYLLDRMAPNTPYGAEHVRAHRIYAPGERGELEAQWHNVQMAVDGLAADAAIYDRIARLMMQVRDIRGTLRRCVQTVLTEVELFEIKRFLLQLGLLAPLFAQIDRGYIGIALTQLPDALALLDPEGQRSAGFAISGAYSKKLAAVRDEKRQAELRLREMPDGAARDELLAHRRALVTREEQETLAVRAHLSEALRPYIEEMTRNAQAIGLLDYTMQKAALARTYHAVRPTVAQGMLAFDAMTNPEMADGLVTKGRAFQPISIEAPQGVAVITGANMGGKSVALRTLALNVLLCQAGFFACAASAALPLFDDICFVAEDLTDTARGLSSFGAEIVRVQGILEAVQGGRYCLVAMDEPARGTNPREGAALVRALVDWLARADAVAVVATHYDGVAVRAQAHYQAAGLSVPEETPAQGDMLAHIAAHMNYGLARVAQGQRAPQEALTVCRLLGLMPAVVDDMADILAGKDADAQDIQS